MQAVESDNCVAWNISGEKIKIGITKPLNGNCLSLGNNVIVALKACDHMHINTIYNIGITAVAKCESEADKHVKGFYAADFSDLKGHKFNASCAG